jgi:hypothetical protein
MLHLDCNVDRTDSFDMDQAMLEHQKEVDRNVDQLDFEVESCLTSKVVKS